MLTLKVLSIQSMIPVLFIVPVSLISQVVRGASSPMMPVSTSSNTKVYLLSFLNSLAHGYSML